MSIRIGTAGWSLTAEMKTELAECGSHLQRYASRFNCVEINSSFYKPHRRKTYERWADSVPNAFRFSVKVPKFVTHERRLRDSETEIARFFDEASGLGEKLGVYLVQLPPSLAFDRESCTTLFATLRSRSAVPIVVEPPHATCFTQETNEFLQDNDIGRVAADPGLLTIASVPGGNRSLSYYRLHGSPQMYYSNYSDEDLRLWHAKMTSDRSGECWCIFDNTALGAAFRNAMTLQQLDRREIQVP
jgi:uncharacterized protein YecE (DUF72 family)